MLGRVVCGIAHVDVNDGRAGLGGIDARIARSAAGVTGTAGLRPGVSAEPVTAHEIMTLRCMPPPRAVRSSVDGGRVHARSAGKRKSVGAGRSDLERTGA